MSYASNQLTTITFNSSGTWVCPGGVTSVLLIGCCGGGSGGGSCGGGSTGQGLAGSGGGGALYGSVVVAVTVGTSYTVTIGAGGTAIAGTAGYITTCPNGNSGGNTTFGTLATFLGASGGSGAGIGATYLMPGGMPIKSSSGGNLYACISGTNGNVSTSQLNAALLIPGSGGSVDNSAGTTATVAYPGQYNIYGGFAGGTAGALSQLGPNYGAGSGGGAAGPFGAGGNGANGSYNSTPANGGSGAANTGAGGAGGAGCGSAGSPSSSGAGGSGVLYVIY